VLRPIFFYLFVLIVTPALMVSVVAAQSQSENQKTGAKEKTAEVKPQEKKEVATAVKDAPMASTQQPAKKVEPQAIETEVEDIESEEPDQDVDVALQSKHLLPPSTKAWVSIPDVDALDERFNETQYGKLARDEAIEPFVESLKQQIRDWLEKRNVRLGIKVEDIGSVQSGEICLAGVLQDLEGGRPARGSHGLVLLVDVNENEDAAWELFDKVNKDLAANRETTLEKFEINGTKVNKTTIKNPKRARYSQVSFQTVSNGWLLAADNEEVFRDILRRLSNPKNIVKAATFGEQERFQAIMKQASLGDNESQINWYVDPFGYIQLAQAISDEDSEARPQRNDWARILQQQGFDVIRGVGGQIGLATGRHEVLHKAFIYAPREKLSKSQQRVFELFDFKLEKDSKQDPADWVPADVAGFFAGNWDFQKVLDNVGPIYDAFLDEGDFDRMINDFKVDAQMKLDIPKLVGMLQDQVTIVSTTERPIGVSSERVCIGLRFEGDDQYLYQSIKRAVGKRNGREINLSGHKVVEVDTTRKEEVDLGDIDLGGIDLGDEESEDEDDEQFNLFDKRYFVVKNGFLLVANEKNFLKKLLVKQQKIKLQDTEDYIEVREALSNLTDPDKVSFRQFGRIDRALETNYEMLRQGKMGQAETVLAKVLNKIFEDNDSSSKTKKSREQKLDGSKLPENYAESIAPFLGPTGWVMECEADGWRITGCLLKKKAISEVVKKEGATDTASSPAQR
jgi:ribosomal protein S6